MWWSPRTTTSEANTPSKGKEASTIRKSFGKRRLTSNQRRFATPQAAYRSGLEEKIAQLIAKAGHTVRFEKTKLEYVIPEKAHTYTPDFVLDNGIIIETKGIFDTQDRAKMKFVKAQHPELDIRMVFSNAMARISKASKTTYAKWCDTYGFPWSHRTIPSGWFTETG